MADLSLRSKTHNFAAGPSPLPTSVLQEASLALLDFEGTGVGICEHSHRGKAFVKVIKDAEEGIRTLLQVPSSHKILFTQGGGTTQFSAVVLNLLSAHAQKASTPATSPPKMDYVVTGTWSLKASQEAARLAHPGKHAEVNIVANTKPSGFTTLPSKSSYKFSPPGEAAFVYFCENETINGVQYPSDPSSEFAFPLDQVPAGTPLVADFSSSFLSRPIPNIERYDVIYAGAQKNLSPAGLVIVIIRDSLLTPADHPATPIPIPEMLSYKTLADSASLYNTPPVFPIYITALVVRLLLDAGGLEAKEKENRRKMEALYGALDQGAVAGAIELKVQKEARSWMNVVWKVKDEAKFLEGAEQRGLRQLKGHRSIGGIRASIYNAVGLESVEALVQWIDEYVAANP